MTNSLPIAFLGVGSTELILVLVVAFVLLGPRELPKIARTMGRLMAKFGSFSQDFRDQVMRIAEEPPPSQPGTGGTGVAADTASEGGGETRQTPSGEQAAGPAAAAAEPGPAADETAKKEDADHEPAG